MTRLRYTYRTLREWISRGTLIIGAVERCVVALKKEEDSRLNNSFRNFWGRQDRVGRDHSIWILFADLREQKSAEARSGSTADRMNELKPLKQIAAFRFVTKLIENWLEQLRSLGVVSLRKVIPSSRLTADERVGSEQLS